MILTYTVPSIPDVSHHNLVNLFGANVREQIFRADEHLLRIVANFGEGQIVLAVRFLFDPRDRVGPQERLRLQLAVTTQSEKC